jgi:Protein of unknown function (DUF4239)
MNDWLHNLPTLWMALLVFGFTYLITAAIYAVVALFAEGERARSFKAVSPGLLSPLGVIFGLFVAFTAAQVWADNEKARAEIDREASALRNVIILATAFPRESEVELREFVRRYISDAATQEWPMMAQGKAEGDSGRDDASAPDCRWTQPQQRGSEDRATGNYRWA